MPLSTPTSPEFLCRRIVADSQDAVIFADREGIIRLWNRGAEEMFGFPAAEALGQPLELIIPENLRDRHNQGYRRAMAAGASKYARDVLAVPARRRDGTRISVEFTVVLVRGEEDEILGTGAIIRDVTARWQQEKRLRERLAALEAELAQAKE